MGTLDDAIREHLDLKRRAGAAPEEVSRLENEAFGAARRQAPVIDEPVDQLPAEELPPPPAAAPATAAAFAAAFVGVFTNELAYAAFRLEQIGWDAALRQLGAIEFFDTAAYKRHVFDREVRAISISSTAGGGVAVYRRRPR